MARRPDISRAVCDTCGKPLLSEEARYTVADVWEEEDDFDVLVQFRHWDCDKKRREELTQGLERLEKKLPEIRGTLNKLKGLLK